MESPDVETKITNFSGKHAFLSNFFPIEVRLENIIFPSVEHAYQAAKTLDIGKRLEIAKCPMPGQAKRMGRKLAIRPDWYAIKIETMTTLLIDKFHDPVLAQMLLDTGWAELIEGNTWGDKFWGCTLSSQGEWIGENILGKKLMAIRAFKRHYNVTLGTKERLGLT